MQVIRLTNSPQPITNPCILLASISYRSASSHLYDFSGHRPTGLIAPGKPVIFYYKNSSVKTLYICNVNGINYLSSSRRQW
jgi:hypothetical protein